MGTDVASPEVWEVLNERLKSQVRGNWLHNFEVDAAKEIHTVESYAYRRRNLESIFATLFVDRSVLVLDEASGIYSTLIHRAGARSVSASSGNRRTCDLVQAITEYLDAPTEVIHSKMVAFYEADAYVDMVHGEGHDFLLALGQVWPMFQVAGQSLDAIVEACAFFVTQGLVFDWTKAEWASPAPPDHYNLGAFCDALRLKFEHVTSYGNWLVVATGKLPSSEEARSAAASRDAEQLAAEPEPLAAPPVAAYEELVPRFRDVVCRSLPADATALVVSKGDARLLDFEGRRAWHFPQAPSGDYAGHYPADSSAAIAHLEALRTRGADFLVFATPSLWWLDHYAGFREHLDRRYDRLTDVEGTCLIFDLRGPV